MLDFYQKKMVCRAKKEHISPKKNLSGKCAVNGGLVYVCKNYIKIKSGLNLY